MALQPVLRELAAEKSNDGLELVFSYLDDCCLAGSCDAVAAAFNKLRLRANDIGLTLSTDKCEVIPTAGRATMADTGLFPPDVIVKLDKRFKLLGGPVGDP
eukprot:10107751-Karenia_brevis.AAC.1